MGDPTSSCATVGIALRVIGTLKPLYLVKVETRQRGDRILVYVRIRDEEWNVYRRYSQFLDTHLRLKKVYPIIGTFEFPPKKTIGKKDARLVESRRKLFQTYLRRVINLMVEKGPEMAAHVSKDKLILMLPFFNDAMDEGNERKKQ